jgi:hypothetical protein
VKALDLEQISFHGSKGFMNQLGVFVCTGAVSDNLPAPQIQQHAEAFQHTEHQVYFSNTS